MRAASTDGVSLNIKSAAARREHVLVVSVQPVPDGSSSPVTGLGLRVWGLARGLQGHGYVADILVLNDIPRNTYTHHGVQVRTAGHSPHWKDLLEDYQVVIVLYCLQAAAEITTQAGGHLLVVLDVYVPWYTETAARSTAELPRAYSQYLKEVHQVNRALARGDLFLCASAVQRDYYTGVLSALGVINPYTYEQQRLLEVPFGVGPPDGKDAPSNPYERLGLTGDDFVVLWFGGIYPWFDFKPVSTAMLELCLDDSDVHLVVVGGKNPLEPNGILTRGYEQAREALAHLDGSQAHFVDWINYDSRAAWFAHADVTVSLNKIGLESRYSWRTRITDLASAGLPLITNGGDAFGDLVVSAGGGFRTDPRGDDLVAVIRRLRDTPSTLHEARRALEALRERYTWEETTKELATLLQSSKAHAEEERFAKDNHLQLRCSRAKGTELVLMQGAHLLQRAREEGLRGMAVILRDRDRPRLSAALAAARRRRRQ